MKRNFMRAGTIAIATFIGTYLVDLALTKIPVVNRVPENFRPAFRQGITAGGVAFAFFSLKK